MSMLRIIGLGLLTTLVTACSGVFYIKTTGQIATGVNFCFYNKQTDAQPSAFNINELQVQKHINASAPTWDIKSWKTVWRIRGPFTAKCIGYGAESAAFQSVVKAVPLTPNSEYRVAADDISGVARISTPIFKIGPDGKVIASFHM